VKSRLQGVDDALSRTTEQRNYEDADEVKRKKEEETEINKR
jgi:hypothetical protein